MLRKRNESLVALVSGPEQLEDPECEADAVEAEVVVADFEADLAAVLVVVDVEAGDKRYEMILHPSGVSCSLFFWLFRLKF